ncbi:MAG: SH3 domain-containing protein [Clostridia bacterium]
MKRLILFILITAICLLSACSVDKANNITEETYKGYTSTPAPVTDAPVITQMPIPTEQANNNIDTEEVNNKPNSDGSLPYIYLDDGLGSYKLRVNVGGMVYVVGCDECISLREEPTTASKVLKQIPLYEEITFFSDMQNGFCKVSYFDIIGYVQTQYLTAYEPQVAAGKFKVVNCKESISLRTAADSSAEVICMIPLGAEVWNCLYTKRNGFNLISYNGINGWAMSEYLEDISDNKR